MTEEGRERLKEGGMEGAYLGDDGRVHIPGKRVTLYSEPSPPQPDKLVVEPVGEPEKQVCLPMLSCCLKSRGSRFGLLLGVCMCVCVFVMYILCRDK